MLGYEKYTIEEKQAVKVAWSLLGAFALAASVYKGGQWYGSVSRLDDVLAQCEDKVEGNAQYYRGLMAHAPLIIVDDGMKPATDKWYSSDETYKCTAETVETEYVYKPFGLHVELNRE